MRGWKLVAAVLAMPWAASAQTGYQSYVNVRFAYAICYPAFMTAQPEAANSDGRVMAARDGGRLAVFGRNNTDNQSLADVVNEDAADLIGHSGTITYRAQKATWAVFSGMAGDTLVYSKTFRRGDQFAVFELTYPRAASARYKPVAEQLSRCFHLLRPSF